MVMMYAEFNVPSTVWQTVLAKSLPGWTLIQKDADYMQFRSPTQELFAVAKVDEIFVVFRHGLMIRRVAEFAALAKTLDVESRKTFDMKDAIVEEEN